MKLLSVHIQNYKILDDLLVDFNKDNSVAVIIGKNGSGKTTLIECLTIIFSKLLERETIDELKKASFPFEFNLRYILRKETGIETSTWGHFFTNYIAIELAYSNELKVILYEGESTFDDWDEIEKKLRQEGEDSSYLLPENIVIYYSGISDIIYKQFHYFQSEIILGSLDGQSKINQPLFYFLPENFPSILLGLLSFQFGEVPNMLSRKFGITGFNKIAIKIKKPSWAKSRSQSEDFWGAKGELSVFLNKIREIANADFEKDNVVFTISSDNELQLVWEQYGSEKRLFEYIVSLQANDLIDSISIDLNKNGVITPYQRLSEGEKQLLVIIGLKELLAGENSLFLLDEPDTYLHPEWKRDFMYEFFNRETEEMYRNFYLITSHSPNIVSALKKGQLKILKNVDGKSKLRTYSLNPYGKPIDEILLDLFNVDGLRYKKVEDEINKLRNMVMADEFNTLEFNNLFEELENDLGRDDEALTELKLEIARRKKIG